MKTQLDLNPMSFALMLEEEEAEVIYPDQHNRAVSGAVSAPSGAASSTSRASSATDANEEADTIATAILDRHNLH